LSRRFGIPSLLRRENSTLPEGNRDGQNALPTSIEVILADVANDYDLCANARDGAEAVALAIKHKPEHYSGYVDAENERTDRSQRATVFDA
jgi:hypothetical protein